MVSENPNLRSKILTPEQFFEQNKPVLAKIFQLLPKPATPEGQPIPMTPEQNKIWSTISGQIFDTVLDHLIQEKATLYARNKIIIEKKTWEESERDALRRGAEIGCNLIRNRFKNKSLARRLMSACLGRFV